MFLIDCQFLNKFILKYLLKKIDTFILIYKVDIEKYFTNNYLFLNIYIKKQIDSKSAITYICREIYIVNYLKVKMFLKIDIIILEQIIVNLNNKTLTVNSCRKLTIDFKIIAKNNTRVRRILKINRKTIVNINTIIKLSICLLQSLLNKDYLFELKLIDIYIYIIDFSIFSIYVCNTSLMLIIINKYINLNYLTKYKKQNCY